MKKELYDKMLRIAKEMVLLSEELEREGCDFYIKLDNILKEIRDDFINKYYDVKMYKDKREDEVNKIISEFEYKELDKNDEYINELSVVLDELIKDLEG